MSSTLTTTRQDRYVDTDVLRAIRTVMTFTIADVFDLTEDEVMWCAYHLDQALKPFAGCRMHSLAAPVRQEMMTGDFSDRLNRRNRGIAAPQRSNGAVAEAHVLDWATVISNVATITYAARPIIVAGFVGAVAGILTELGVGNPVAPRASRYLPNAIRFAK